MQILSAPDKSIIKCNTIYNGNQKIYINQQDQTIQFDNREQSQSYYVNTVTGQTNMLFDVNQLEGKSLNNFTIKNFRTNNIIVSSKVDGDFDLEETLDEMILNNKINVQNIQDLQNKYLDIKTQIQTNKQIQDEINQNYANNFQNIDAVIINHTQQIQQLFIDNNNFKSYISQTNLHLKNIDTKDVEQDKTLEAHWDKILEIIALLNHIDARYITKDDLSGLASEASVIGLGVTVGVIGIETTAATAAAATANASASSALSICAAHTTAIGQLSSDIAALNVKTVQLEAKEELLTGDVAVLKTDNETTKVEVLATKASLTKSIVAQEIINAGFVADLTNLQTMKADKDSTYTKDEVDYYFVKQDDTNTLLNNGILQLGSSKANNTDVYTKTEVDNKLVLKTDKTYVDTGFNLYGSQLTTLKTRADNIEILNTTQNSQIAALQTKDNQFVDVINTILSVNSTQSTDITGLKTRCTNIETLNTTQSNMLTSLSTDIATLRTSDTKQTADIAALQISDTKQTGDIAALQISDTNQNAVLQIHTANFQDLDDRCKAIEEVDVGQQTILDIHTGNFGAINQNFTDIWGRLDTIETTDLSNVIKRLDFLDVNVGDMMPTVDFNNKWRMNEAVPKISALETDNTTNKTNIANLTTRANEQDQTNLTFGSKIYTLQTNDTKQNNDIFNINNSITTINTNMTSLTTRVTNLENYVYNYQTRGEGWRRTGWEQTCYGTTNVITSGGGYAWINFALPFTQVCEYVATVKRTDANGSGCDVIYCDVELGRIRIQHDFASTANMIWFNWTVTGFWR
ncbi:Hypothetical_protein [Hexamita inflata]|uniref:Hypothetical_protein n=1 Tax=Hexamita inflata TaxID=28002 RepID=A0AA86Q9B1_9EUKA|nr:Hypothetical protein HINF_LOCUS38933 [Hexamita inflata]